TARLAVPCKATAARGVTRSGAVWRLFASPHRGACRVAHRVTQGPCEDAETARLHIRAVGAVSACFIADGAGPGARALLVAAFSFFFFTRLAGEPCAQPGIGRANIGEGGVGGKEGERQRERT